jgi:hypothetical protein
VGGTARATVEAALERSQLSIERELRELASGGEAQP